MRLDLTQPVGEVIGLPGVRWDQGGHLFDPSGREVRIRREGVGDDERTIIERVGGDDEPEPAPAPPPKGDMHAMHWKQLKVMLDVYGEAYTTKEAAIAFLEGRNAA